MSLCAMGTQGVQGRQATTTTHHRPRACLNPIGPRQYLVYIYVNRVAIEAALNLIVSIRRYDIRPANPPAHLKAAVLPCN